MEQSTIPVNSVNISLSDYNVVKSNLDTTRDLLSKATAELDVLRNQEPKNKLIIVEKQERDQRYGGMRTVESLTFNVTDPEASTKILDAISKVETSELTEKILAKEIEVKNLKDQLIEKDEYVDSVTRSNRHLIQTLEEKQEDKLHKITRLYEEQILGLTEDKDDLSKALSDLKKDKTQQQIELARQEEIDDLREKLNAAETFRSNVENVSNNPFKLKSFLNSVSNASRFINYNQWMNKLKNRVYDATERVEAFANMIKNVGKLPQKEVVYTPGINLSSLIYGTPGASTVNNHYVTNNYNNEDY